MARETKRPAKYADEEQAGPVKKAKLTAPKKGNLAAVAGRVLKAGPKPGRKPPAVQLPVDEAKELLEGVGGSHEDLAIEPVKGDDAVAKPVKGDDAVAEPVDINELAIVPAKLETTLPPVVKPKKPTLLERDEKKVADLAEGRLATFKALLAPIQVEISTALEQLIKRLDLLEVLVRAQSLPTPSRLPSPAIESPTRSPPAIESPSPRPAFEVEPVTPSRQAPLDAVREEVAPQGGLDLVEQLLRKSFYDEAERGELLDLFFLSCHLAPGKIVRRVYQKTAELSGFDLAKSTAAGSASTTQQPTPVPVASLLRAVGRALGMSVAQVHNTMNACCSEARRKIEAARIKEYTKQHPISIDSSDDDEPATSSSSPKKRQIVEEEDDDSCSTI